MIEFHNKNKMSDKEVDDLILKIINDMKKSPGFGEVKIGIIDGKVSTIKPTPTYNLSIIRGN